MTAPAPWQEVKAAVTGPEAARLLGLKRARERGKWACVACASSDGLHVYRNGAHCFSCSWSGSVIDMAACRWRVQPAEACRQLAARIGVQADTFRMGPPPAPAPSKVQEPEPDARAEVYGSTLDLLVLGPRGRAYLSGRGISPALAEAHGLRSLEAPTAWGRLFQNLADLHGREAVVAAGLHPTGPGAWRGQVPALVLAYLSSTGEVTALRFRRIDGGGELRYMTPVNGGARIPYRAEALDAPRPLHIVVAEGELDALALAGAGYDSVGLGGATPSRAVVDWLVDALEDAERVALWTDPDPAGNKAVDRLVASLLTRYGPGWVRGRVERWRASSDPADALKGAA